MSCPPPAEILLHAERIQESGHARECDDCRAVTDELRATMTLLRRAGKPRRVPWIPLLTAAAVILATLIGVFMQEPPRKPVVADTSPKKKKKPLFAKRRTLPALTSALRWLEKNQEKDGSWDGNAGVTGLTLLSFFANDQGETRRCVRNGINWLISKQDDEGCLVDRKKAKYTYHHAIGTWALVEAAGGDYSLRKEVRAAAQAAVDFLVAAQNPGKGWRYSFVPGDNDSSVTFWASMALVLAKKLGFRVPDKAVGSALAWFEEATEPNGRTGYTMARTGRVFIPGVNDAFSHHETLTAAAVTFRIFSGSPRHKDAVKMIDRDRPRTEDNEVDYYYWHIGSMAVFHSGTPWGGWKMSLGDAIREFQEKDGSWKPVGRWCGEASRAYATAINALTLTTEGRYSLKP